MQVWLRVSSTARRNCMDVSKVFRNTVITWSQSGHGGMTCRCASSSLPNSPLSLLLCHFFTLFGSSVILSLQHLHEQPGHAVWVALVGYAHWPPLPSHPMSSNCATLQISSCSYLHNSPSALLWYTRLCSMLSTVQLLFVNIMFITPSEPLPMPRLGIYLSQLQCFQPCLQPSCQWHEPTALQKGIAPSLHNQKNMGYTHKNSYGYGMGYGTQFPTHQTGGQIRLWVKRGYGLSGVWDKRGSTVHQS